MLLPSKCFGQPIKQPIKLQIVEGKENAHACAETPNFTTLSAVGQSELRGMDKPKDSILSKEASKANQKNNSYSSIHIHLEDFTKHAKPESVKLKGCRVSKGLLMKRNQLYVSDDKDLQLRVIKEIHNQPAVGHFGRKRTSNMVQHHYYWPCMRNTIEQYI